LIRQAFDRDIVDFSGGFTRHHQAGSALAELDPIGDVMIPFRTPRQRCSRRKRTPPADA